MTDNENFALILKKLDTLGTDMQGMKSDIQDMKSDIQELKVDMQGVKGDIQNLKDDMQGVKGDIQNLKDDMQGVKGDINGLKNDVYILKRQVRKSTSELTTMDKLILDEVERVHILLDNHIKNKTVHSTWHHYSLVDMGITPHTPIQNRTCAINAYGFSLYIHTYL